jgi:hypothetical protein
MGTLHPGCFIPAWRLALGLVAAFSVWCQADTALYNDGVWIVNGIDEPGTNLNRIAVTVGGQPAGNFTELAVFRSFGGGFPQVYSIQADGSLQPAVPPSGVLGGTFHLTGYWDCYAGQQLDLRFVALNIQPNTKKLNSLRFNGTVSNGSTLQATDYAMTLDLPNDSTVRLDVRYTLYATANVCVDQWEQQSSQGFQAVRIASNYISSQEMKNDGLQIKGYLGPFCDCCHCWWQKGYICANFTNQTGSVLPYSASMASSQLLMVHRQVGPNNTAALKIDLKSPSRSSCMVQGSTVLTADPAEDNVSLWINWGKAKSQYTIGKKVRPFRFKLEAQLPQAVACDYIVVP